MITILYFHLHHNILRQVSHCGVLHAKLYGSLFDLFFVAPWFLEVVDQSHTRWVTARTVILLSTGPLFDYVTGAPLRKRDLDSS